MDVGIVGLGAMGYPMCEALLAAGHRVVAFDLSAAALARAVAAGAEPATSSAELGASVPVVLLSLPKPEHVATVVTGERGILTDPARDLVVVDTSTVDPDTTRRMAALAGRVGVGYLDAPILGRPDACGAWTFPVGGEAAALERVRPALAALGSTIVHAGPPGAGNAIKLLNNLMFGAINTVTAEVMAACGAVGIAPATFFEIVAGSGAATVSPLFRQLGRKIVDGDFSPTFTVDLMHKDVSLAMEMLGDRADALTMAHAVRALADAARAAGHGAEDTSALVKVYASRLEQ